MTIQVKRVKASKFRQTIDDYETSGWHLKNSNDRIAVLTGDSGWGAPIPHIIIAVFTCWWTLFIGNVIYALWAHYYNVPEIHVKIDESD